MLAKEDPTADTVELRALERSAAGEDFFALPRRALSLGATLLALFLLLALLVPNQSTSIDRHWAEWMDDIQTAVLKHVALVFNELGHGIGRALTIVAIGVVLIVARRWWALLAFALTEGLAPLISTVTKSLVDRPRPPDGLVHPSGASFPSGHATYAGATCVALVLLFSASGRRRRLWWCVAAVGILAMAWSRTYLKVHWLLEVVGGSLLGAGVALVVFAGLQLLRVNRGA